MMETLASPHSCAHCHSLLETTQHERGRMLLAPDALSPGFAGARVSMSTGSSGAGETLKGRGEASHVGGKMQGHIHIKGAR